MRASFAVLAAVALSGALLAACGGGGSSSTHAGVLPARSKAIPAPAGAAGKRRPANVAVGTCTNDTANYEFIGSGYNNIVNAPYGAILDGYQNKVCDSASVVVGGEENVIASGNYTTVEAFIGGGYDNAVGADATYSAIVAGEGNGISGSGNFVGGGAENVVQSDAGGSTIVGGTTNIVSAANAFIGGGNANTVSSQYGAIGAGTNDSVSGEGAYIGGGGYNAASGEGAVVDGGFAQTASGTFATIPGGYRNSAAGTYSFAAGAFGSAAQEGTFVWSDGSNGSTVLTSSRAYQFLARASGGFTLYTNAAATVGAQLGAGSGTWASLSDRNAKTNIVPLDDSSVLAKVAALPIARWSYKTEHGVRHVGPMAQDFYAAFGVGEDDRHIASIDEDGVALAAIKALHAECARLRRELAAERAHDRRVDAEIAGLEARASQ